MADTTNYGWTKPTVGGDTDAWGTKLNTAFDDIDSDLKTVEDKADAAQAGVDALIGDFRIAAGGGREIYSSDDADAQWVGTALSALTFIAPASGTVHKIGFRLPALPVGATLSAIRSYGSQSGHAVQVSLVQISEDGTLTEIDAGHALPSSAAVTETTGIAHTIVADMDYWILLTPAISYTGTATLRSVGYTIEAA